MIDVIINHDNSFITNINPFESIYNLKEQIYYKTNIEIERQMLFFNGKELKNNITLHQSKIENNSIIQLTPSLIGGFDILTMWMWIFYLYLLFLYIGFLFSGLLPVMAHSYSYILTWALDKLAYFFGYADSYVFIVIRWIITFSLRIGIIYFFLFTVTTLIALPILYISKGHKMCAAVNTSSKIAYWVTILFILSYGIMEIPNELLALARATSSVSIYSKIIIAPLSGILEQFANIGKFGWLYAIPIIGTPIIEGYHTAISAVVEIVYETANNLAELDCRDEKTMTQVGKILKNWRNIPSLKDIIVSYSLQTVADVLPIALIKSVNERKKCEIENMPFLERYSPFNNEAAEYYTANLAKTGFCFGLDVVRAFTGVMDSMGASLQISDMIKSGSIGGAIAYETFFITMILALLGIIS